MQYADLDLFRTTLDHHSTSKFLYYAQFSPALDTRIREALKIPLDTDLKEYFGMFRPGHVSLKVTEVYKAPDFTRYFNKEEITEGAFINGIGVLEIPGSRWHFTRYVSPLRNAETMKELEEYPYPDLAGISFEGMKEQVEVLHAMGRVAVMWIGHMYETAWQIRGYEQFLEDMLLEPDRCALMLDRLMMRNVALAKAAAQAGCDFIMTGDDVANQKTLMFSREHWQQFMKPRWHEVFQAARSVRPDIQIWYHSDGNIMEIIPELLEIGVTILNPIQPECMDPAAVKRLLGRRAVMDGAIGTQTTMPFGTAREVKQVIRERIDTIGCDGGWIISPTHMLEPEVPVGNVLAFMEAVQEYNG